MKLSSATTAEVSDSPWDSLYTVEEAADRLRTSVSTMRYWQQVGKGPKSFKLGVRRLYKMRDLDAWVQEQYKAQTGEDT